MSAIDSLKFENMTLRNQNDYLGGENERLRKKVKSLSSDVLDAEIRADRAEKKLEEARGEIRDLMRVAERAEALPERELQVKRIAGRARRVMLDLVEALEMHGFVGGDEVEGRWDIPE
jgi:chromosome segregation ATPase